MNVLMIVSDTLRQDFLGINGGRVRTPNLDALARESVYFRRAYANSFPTVPARADYLTGRFSFTDVGWGPLPRTEVTLPQLLAANGVTTIGVVDTPFYVRRGYNYDRGFQYFYDLPTQWQVVLTQWQLSKRAQSTPSQDTAALESLGRAGSQEVFGWVAREEKGASLNPFEPASEYDYCAPLTMVTAERALERLTSERFYLLVDTWDPHEPWNPPHYYAKRYKPDYDGRVVNPVYGPYADAGLTEDDLETAIACYCGELEMVDRWIGRLLERLESLGLAEDTAVIFVSDHGFYFGEYGVFGKMTVDHDNGGWLRSPLYPEVANVPLMIRVPGVAPRNEDRVVSSAINIAPTVLDLFGLEKPGQMVGRSLLPLVRSVQAPSDEVAITATPLASPGDAARFVDDLMRAVNDWQPITITTNEWMMLFSRWEDAIELYETADSHLSGLGLNCAAERPDIVEQLHTRLIAELKRAGASEDAIVARG